MVHSEQFHPSPCQNKYILYINRLEWEEYQDEPGFTDLSQTLLPRPHRGVDDLEEELSSTRVEYEDGTIDGLGGQVTLKCLEGEESDKE